MIHARFPLVASVLVLLATCGSSNTAEFGPPKTMPKEQRPTQWDASAKERLQVPDMAPARKAPAEGGAPSWTGDTPAGFETQPANPAKFRDAVWRVAGNPDTEIYLTAAVGGGVAMNMGRWYSQQFALPQVPALESLPIVELAGNPARLAELKGTYMGKAGWAALVAFRATGDQLMTLKFTGPEAAVFGNKDKFSALAKSLRQASASPNPNAPPIDPNTPMPANHPATGAASPGASPPPPAASPFTATVPAGWTAKAGSSKPLHHTFGKSGEVYVSQLGGTLKSSLDIWRGEMGQKAPLTDAELAALPKIAFLGEDAVLLDLSGDLQGMTRHLSGARLLLAARADGGSIAFVKLVGTADEVGSQLDAFRAFCGSIRRAP